MTLEEEAPSSTGGVGRDLGFADEEDEDVKISFAFLMYGQARTLNRTHCSVYENIVKPILDRKHTRVHFFIRAEADEDAWQFEAFAEEIDKRRREEEEEKRRRNNEYGKRGEDDPSPPRLRYTLEIERYRNRAKNASRRSRKNTRSARIESREVRKGVIPESF